MNLTNYTIAVLIPCYNEEASIGNVITDFRSAIPHAEMHVFDNNSTDNTVELARKAGAYVHDEPYQGKGNVIRRMFADVNADIYVLVDGDGTYDAQSSLPMIEKLIEQQLDMVNGARNSQHEDAYRTGHEFGNRMISGIVAKVFGNQFKDMLSGFRVFSHRFVKSFPTLSSGFEIETEMTIHALDMKMKVAELTTRYSARIQGSESKLSTFKDGFRILRTIFYLIKEEKPLPFFSLIFVLLCLLSVILAYPIFLEYLETGLVPRFPTAILSASLALLGFLSLTCGLILDTVTRGRREAKRLHYLRTTFFMRDMESRNSTKKLTNDLSK